MPVQLHLPQNISRDVQRIALGWHSKTWSLECVKPEVYADALTMCFHNENWCLLRNKRAEQYNSIVTQLKSDHVNVGRLNNAFRHLKEIDDQMAVVLLQTLANYSIQHDENRELISDSDLAKREDLTDEQREALVQISTLQRQLSFKFESIENDLTYIDEAVRKFDDTVQYSAADGIRASINQFRSFIDSTNEKLTTQEEQDLYNDTADRISEYFSKQVATYNRKLARLQKKKAKAS